MQEFLDTAELKAYLGALFAAGPVPADDKQLEQLTALIVLLTQWNKSLNLTAIKEPQEMARLHILDSAVISPLLGDASRIADVGTGAGFPGLVLAVLNPDKEFTLIDSVGKKLSFVRAAAVKLQLRNVKITQGRVEELQVKPGFDVIVSRAFAPLERMVNWCLPLLQPSGRFIAMKAHLSEEELNAVPQSVRIAEIVNLQVPSLTALRQAVILTRA